MLDQKPATPSNVQARLDDDFRTLFVVPNIPDFQNLGSPSHEIDVIENSDSA
jgi:hypothetical protein